jgi:hypothetical protein
MSDTQTIQVKSTHLAAIIKHGDLDEIIAMPRVEGAKPMWLRHNRRHCLLTLFPWDGTPQGHEFWSHQRGRIE